MRLDFFKVDKNNSELMERIFRFRCEILCDELKYFDKKNYPDGLEKDRYDKFSIHYAAVDENGNLVSTVRLIYGSQIGYPTENNMVIYEDIKKSLNREKLGEISRIFIAKKFRNFKTTKLIITSFIRLIYIDMKRLEIEYSYGALELGFLRLLRLFKIRYEIIGDLQNYGGMRYPALLYTSVLEKDNPELLRSFKGANVF